MATAPVEASVERDEKWGGLLVAARQPAAATKRTTSARIRIVLTPIGRASGVPGPKRTPNRRSEPCGELPTTGIPTTVGQR